MFDDGILRLVRMLDDVSVWSSDVNLNAFDGVMLSANNSDLRRFQQAVLAGNQNLARTIYNDMLPQTRAALNRNTSANSLAFVDPLLAYNNAAWNAMQVALNSYLTGQYSLIRNVKYTSALKSYTQRYEELAIQATELNLPDLPSKPGGFSVQGSSGIRPPFTEPVGEAPGNTTNPGTGPGNQLPPGTGGNPPPPPPPPPVLAPTINLISTNTSTNIRSVNITHSEPLAQIRVILNGTTAPSTIYTLGSLINIPPGSVLRTTATIGSNTSTISSYTNTLPTITPPPGNGSGNANRNTGG
jgi:hypothetical protein